MCIIRFSVVIVCIGGVGGVGWRGLGELLVRGLSWVWWCGFGGNLMGVEHAERGWKRGLRGEWKCG